MNLLPAFVSVLKVWKTDPFKKGCFIHIGKGQYPLCAIRAPSGLSRNEGRQGGPPSPFLFQGGPLLSYAALPVLAAAGISGQISSHSSRMDGAMVAARNGVSDTSSRSWVGGPATYIICTLFSHSGRSSCSTLQSSCLTVILRLLAPILEQGVFQENTSCRPVPWQCLLGFRQSGSRLPLALFQVACAVHLR